MKRSGASKLCSLAISPSPTPRGPDSFRADHVLGFTGCRGAPLACRTAGERAHVVARTVCADGDADLPILPLLDEFTHHFDKRPAARDRARASEADAFTSRRRRRLRIEVVAHLDMIADEADRDRNDIAYPLGRQGYQPVVDVGLQPGHRGRSG